MDIHRLVRAILSSAVAGVLFALWCVLWVALVAYAVAVIGCVIEGTLPRNMGGEWSGFLPPHD